MRRDLTSLVAKLSATERIEDLALTTNGVLLERMADELRAAGLHRVNIGLSSTQTQNYREVTGFDFLEQVTGGIHKAIEAGLEPVKVNAVVLKGLNDCQITELARMSVRLPIIVRFVEYYPTTRHTRPATEYVPNYTVRHIIEREFGPLSNTTIRYSGGPASYFKIPGSVGAIGFIDCRTAVFCHSCNRLRLTSDGRIRPCLYSAFDYDIKRILRSGAADEQVRRLLRTIVDEKYQFTRQNSFVQEFCMRKVGG